METPPAASPSNLRPGPLPEAAALAAILVGAVLAERARSGVELQLVAFAVLLAGPLWRRWLAWRGRLANVPWPAFGLELAGASGLRFYPPARWASGFAGLAALGLALPFPAPTDAPRASRAEEGASAAFALVATLACVLATRAAGALPLALWLPLVALAAEAWGPRAPRSVADAARRASGFALLAASAILFDRERSPESIGFHFFRAITEGEQHLYAEDFVLLGSTVLGLAAALEVLVRATAPRDADLAPRRRRVVLRLAAVSFVPVLVWSVGELAFHVVPNDHRDLTLGARDGSTWHVPGGRYVYEGPTLGHREPDLAGQELVWNREGLHDRDHDLEKPRGCARVLVLGDSYMEGYQLPLEDLFHRRLESALATATPEPAKVETLAIAQAGWGQAQELEALEKRGLRYDPDLVLVEFLPGNDVRNNHPELEALAGWGAPVRQAKACAIAGRLWFTAFLCDQVGAVTRSFAGLPPVLDAEVFLESPPPARAALWREAWERTDALVGELAQATGRSGAKLVVFSLTTPSGWPGDLALPGRRMAEICRRRDVAFLDLAPRFAARFGPALPGVHLRYDGHWTQEAHRFAAAEAATYLTKESDLWRGALARAAAR